MSIRPPKALAPRKVDDNPLNAALEHEVLAEKAATYGRLLARLEKSLKALREFEGANESRHDAGEVHDSLLAEAGEALWHVVIQRDLCGFRNHEMFYREYDIPAAVRLRMGLRPRTGR